MATSDKLQKLLETKAQIRQAIIDKGVEVGEDVVFADYSNKIAAIETSGGSDNFLALRTNNHTNYSSLFEGYKEDSLEPFALDTWDTSNVTDMDHMFSICKVKDYNLSNWDFSKVADTHNMFNYSDAVNIDLSNWRVGPEIESIDMSQMFVGCYDLETLDIRNFNIADCNLKNSFTGNAFQYCNKLHTLRLDNCSKDTINKIITSIGFPTGLVDGEPRKIFVNPDNIGDLTAPTNWIFVDLDGNEIVPEIPLYQPDMFRGNRDIEEVSVMVTSKHDDLNNMFSECENLRTINGINDWDTSNVTNMERMFNRCGRLESLDLSSFNTSNVEKMNNMFFDCRSLKELNLSFFEIKEDCGTDSMLNRCRELHILRLDNCNEDTIRKIIASRDFPTGETGEGKRKIYCLEENVANLAVPYGWELVDAVTGEVIVLEEPEFYMPGYYSGNRRIEEATTMVTSEHTDLSEMFRECENLRTINNISEWDTSNVTNMNNMFKSCRSLESLDLSSFNTSNVNNMESMFNGCESLESLDLSSFDTSNVTNMDCMFKSCRSLASLDLNDWDVSKVESMSDMIQDCESLVSLDLSNWDVSSVTNMWGMFADCDALETLDLSNWDMTNVSNTTYMFNNSSNLRTLILDDCDKETIRKIITVESFPTGDIGVLRQIFVKEDVSDLTEPEGWVFVNVE